VEWIHFPRIRTFVEKRFHGLFSEKKRSKSGGVPSFESFPRREHVLAVISLSIGQPTALDGQKVRNLSFWYLNGTEVFGLEKRRRGVNLELAHK